MLPEELIRKLKKAETRIAFAAGQTSGVISSELAEALKEIRTVTNSVQPQIVLSEEEDAVLFVDDEEIIRRIGSQMLENGGYKVLTAGDGIEALEVFQRNSPSVRCVVLDLVMPRMDGLQTFKQLRRITPDVGVVITTGYSEEEVTRRFGKLKLQGVLRKPFTAGALLKMVEEAIEKTNEKG